MKTTDDNFHTLIYNIVKKYADNPQKCFEKLMELKYPNSNEHVQLEHAKFFYEKYMKLAMDIELDENFTENAYKKNSKIYKDTHL